MSLKLQDMEHTIQLSLGNIVAVTGTTHSQVHSIVYSCHYKTTAHKAYNSTVTEQNILSLGIKMSQKLQMSAHMGLVLHKSRLYGSHLHTDFTEHATV